MKFRIQFDYHGRFRIVAQEDDKHSPGGSTPSRTLYGEWAGYTSLATLCWEGEIDGRQVRKTFIASSEYGLLPNPEEVYELSVPFSTTLDDSMQYIDSEGVDHRAEDTTFPKAPTKRETSDDDVGSAD